MKTKYVKLKLGEPNEGKEIFVREEDYKNMIKSLKTKNSEKVVSATLQLLSGSPDGLNDLVDSLQAFSFIGTCKHISVLKNFKDLINNRIKNLSKKKEKKNE